MNSNQTDHSEFYNEFQNGIRKIISQTNNDKFHNKLYYSNVISLMEKYLYDLFIYKIKSDRNALVTLGTQNKFNNVSLKIPYLLHNSVEEFIINAMKNIVWHRLNDIDVFYKKVLRIQFNLNREILNILKTRHDIVHRNGFDLDGNMVEITDQKLETCINLINQFILDIDKKYQALQN
ncbi:RiboL-PSP-HEPN domain-containing protein [Candidatus Magnetomoraceae bacterium gMMP-15]